MSSDNAKQKPVCFVIGPIGGPGSDVRKKADMLFNAVIKPIVENEFTLLRADKEQKPGMITDSIIQRVMESELVIADLTGLNPNVFYELGIRHAAAKPTIHITTDGTPLPFDNAGYSTIFLQLDDWSSIESGRSDLRSQTNQTRLPDFKASNPVTQAVTMIAFAASSDNEERSIAILSKRIESLESEIKRRVSPNATARSANTPSDMLLNAFDDIDRRKRELKNIVDIIRDNAGSVVDEIQASYWIEGVANNPSEYAAAIKQIDSGNISAVVSSIMNYVPF